MAPTPSVLVDDGFITWSQPSSADPSIRFTHLDRTGNVVWQRAFAADASTAISAVTADPAGNVLFGGTTLSRPDFGGGPISFPEGDVAPAKGFVVKLSSAGDHVFSMRPGLHDVNGIASNGDRIVVSGTRRFDLWNARLISLDANGQSGHFGYGDAGWTELGDNLGAGLGVQMAADGHVWWRRTMVWPFSNRQPSWGPFLLSLNQ